MEESKRRDLERWLDNFHLRRDTRQVRMESNPKLFLDLDDFLMWLDLGVDLDDNMLNELLRMFEEADLVASGDRDRFHHHPVPPAE